MNGECRKTILLVEDEAIIAIAQKVTLEKNGYEVVTAYSGETALEVFRENQDIGMVLMDIDLGKGIDGTETARIILAEREIPVVFLSSHTEPNVVERTEKITSYGYVVKNSGITVLDASIKMAFRLFEANRQIIESENKQKAMISNISDVIGIIGKDGIIKYESPNIEKWFGWMPEELVGRDGLMTVHQDDADRIKKIFFSVLEEENRTRTVEYSYRCKDGSYKPVELTAVNCINNPAINGILINYHDITERKKAEDELNYQEHLLNTIIESTSEAIFAKNMKGEYQTINESGARMLGYKKEDVIGRRDEDLLNAEIADEFRKTDELVIKGNKFFEREETGLLEGRVSTFLAHKTPWRNSSGEIIGVIGVSSDITERKRIEEALHKSEKRYTEAQKIGHVGSWEYNLQTTNFWGSDEAKRIYGFDPAKPDFTTDEVENCIPERERVHQALVDLIEKGEKYDLEFKIYPRDNSEPRIIWSVAELQRDEKGLPVLVSGVIQDITERKRIEEKLRDSMRKLDDAQNLARIGFWDLYMDPLSLTWTKGLKRIFDIDPDGPEPTLEEFWGFVHPDDMRFVEEQFEKQIHPVDIPEYTYEYRIITGTGDIKYLNHIGRQITDSSGHVVEIYGSVQDITDRKITESAIKSQNEELEAANEELTAAMEELDAANGELIAANENLQEKEIMLLREKVFTDAVFESIPGYLYVYDEQGNLIRWNRKHETMTGYSSEELSKMNLARWYEGDDAVRVAEAVENVFKNGYGEVEALLLTKNGEKLLTRSNGVRLEVDGKTYFTGVGVDIGEQKRAEEQVRKLLDEKELLLREVHHRIRNFMNTLTCLLSLHSGSIKEPSARTALEDAVNRIQSMMQLYDRLYQVPGSKEVSVLKFLSPLVDEILSNFPECRSVKIEKNIGDFILDTKKAQPLGIIVNELLTNIMKYAFIGRSDGLIYISSEVKGNKAEFVIRDNGVGIPESVNLKNSSGLGLVLVETLTEQIGGTIRLERDSGTMFVLEFEI